jgi:predicted MFS family arabinose efflux permease
VARHTRDLDNELLEGGYRPCDVRAVTSETVSLDSASRGRRVAFAGSLVLAMGAGVYPLFAINALAPLVTADLDITRAQLGTVSALAFAIAAVGGVVGGRVVNQRTARVVLVVLYLAGAVACLAVAAADSYVQLVLAAAICGVALSFSNPVTNHLVAERVQPGRQGTLMGVKQSGVQVAQLLAGALLPTMAVFWYWRGALAVSVVLPLLGVAAAILLFPPAPGSPVQARTRRVRQRLDPAVWRLSAYAFLMGVVVQGTGTYLALYAFERVHLGATTAGLAVAVVGLVGTFARVLWGRRVEASASDAIPLAVLAVLAMLSMFVLLSASHVGSVALWGGTVLFGVSAVAANVVVMLAVLRRCTPSQTAQASGVVGAGMYLGFMVGPPAFGLIVDHAGSYDPAWVGLAVVCTAAVAVSASLRRSEVRR